MKMLVVARTPTSYAGTPSRYLLGAAYGRGGLEDTSSSYTNTDIRHVMRLESAKHSRSGNGGPLPTLGVTSIPSCFSCSLVAEKFSM